ncbi:UvrD-helicase domain-containing protein [Marinobacter sp. NFXS9]|uniref:UvrD-helicase domain-containing protein n=1 Tax=Marinobacter sp. NFXS9 TaxID=2818433 RepID=UPI0032DE4CC6
MNLNYTQASAGSGKTYSIENDVAEKLERGELLPSEIIAVTFTIDAAEELKGRISRPCKTPFSDSQQFTGLCRFIRQRRD